MLVLSGSRTFRMDCFAFISKTDVSSRRNVDPPKRTFRRQIRTSPNNEVHSLGSDQISAPKSSVTNSFAARRWILASQCRGFGIQKYSPTARFKSKVGVDQASSRHWYWKVKVSYRTSSLFLSLLNCLFDGSQQRIFKDSSCASQKSYCCI